MPGRLKVRLLSARDLPVMDRGSDSTDAFVEVRFDGEMFKTEVFKKSLNPQWNSEWFMFEADDDVLQDEPLDIRVLDYDTYSAHDAIGKVYIDLTPLLSNDLPYVISGWFPIYDTMHGIRGELNVQVKVELFSDVNRFRQSSCEIQFFCSAAVPSGFRLQGVQGFVEELVVNDDPEYQLIDKLRTSRASNEARQRLFSKLSGGLQRKVGVKVNEMGGNAVLGYTQNFDLEGESGIVVRAIGTAVNIAKIPVAQFSPQGVSPNNLKDVHGSSLTNTASHPHHHSHHHHHHHHHHHNPPPLQQTPHAPHHLFHHARSRRRSSSASYHHRQSLTIGLMTSPPSTPTKVARGSETGSSPPPSAPPIVSPTQGFDFGSFEESSRGEDKDAVFSSSSPFTDDGTASESATLLAGTRSSVSPVRSTGLSASSGNTPRLSDSDLGSPTGGSSVLDMSSGSYLMNSTSRTTPPRSSVNQQNISMLEFPFFTMRSFPPGFIVNLGSVVAARSVKLLDKIHNPEEPETRDMWWSEIRTEIRSHARAMNCHAVLGYVEQTTICDEIIILSATGTAARITCDLEQAAQQATQLHSANGVSVPAATAADPALLDKEKDKDRRLTVDIGLANQLAQTKLAATAGNVDGGEEVCDKCWLCHIPYRAKSLPFPVNLSNCALCKKKKVPDILFTTVDPPKGIPTLSLGYLIQARVCRTKSKGKGSETAAREVSDSLPFLEYELHTQLLNKLKMRGLNTIFGLKIQICLGETMITALATGTGVYLAPMPQPPHPKMSTQVQVATQAENRDMTQLQSRITDIVLDHRHRLNAQMSVSEDTPRDRSPFSNPTDDSEEDQSDAGDSFFPAKDTFILEIDDPKDEILALILKDCVPPEGFQVCNTQLPPGVPFSSLICHTQMFTQVAQVRYLPNINTKLDFANIFETLLRRICFKLRRLAPCCLTDLNFTMAIPDEDEVQISVTGCCLTLGDPRPPASGLLTLPSGTPSSSCSRQSSRHTGSAPCEDLMFNLEIDPDKEAPSSAISRSSQPLSFGASGSKQSRQSERRRQQSVIPKRSTGVELTPLPTVIGGKIVKYLGNFNFFLIRESTSVKECGGLAGFMQNFVSEVMAIVRGHVSALGGNALVGYQMSHCVVFSNLHKNQAQCLINVCGDAVQVTYGVDAFPSALEPSTAASDVS